jgi:ATP-binding cassette subfamily C protein
MIDTELLEQCSLLTFQVGTTIHLLGSDRFWMVHKGAIDVFFVQLHNNAESAPRKHIFRAKAGEVVFGLPQFAVHNDYALVAVGLPGAEVSECDFAKAIALTKDQEQLEILADLLNKWIINLFAGIKIHKTLPENYVTIDADETVFVIKDAKLRSPKKQCLWIKSDLTALTINDDANYFKIKSYHYFPIVPSAWLTADEASNIDVYTTQQLIVQNLLDAALYDFYELLLYCYLQDFKEQSKQDIERLQRKSFLNRLHLINAISGLKNILVFKLAKEPLIVDWQDPLYAACKMMAQRLGINIISKTIYKKFARSDSVEDIARLSNFSIRNVKLLSGWSGRDNGILIVSRNNHPVVLLPKSTNSYEAYDPATGTAEVISDADEASFAIDAYMFYRPFPQEAISGKRFLQFAMKNTFKDSLFLFVVGTCGALLSLLIPIMTKIIFDDVIPSAAYRVLFQVALLLFVAIVCTTIFNFARNIAFLRIDGKVGTTLQTAIWDRLLHLPTAFFRKYSTGDLAQRAVSISIMRQQISSSYVYVVLGLLFAGFNLLLLFYYSSILALIAVGMSLFLLTMFCGIGFFLYKYSKKIRYFRGKLSGLVNQLINGIIKLRITNTEERAFSIWANLFGKQQELAVKEKMLNNSLDVMYGVFPIFSTLVIFWWFATMGIGDISLGKFLAFNAAFVNFQVAILQFGLVFPGILNILPLYERMKPILQELPELTEQKLLPEKLTGNIRLDKVSFRYNENGPAVLKNVSLAVNPEEFVAIVGESGAGKSTIFRLLLGFETPEMGDIYYDNKNLSLLNPFEVRQQLGVVLQGSKLMAGSVYENISGTSNITIDEAYEIACMAGLKDDIDAMPMQMHTFIGVGGSSLSEGQRQRLIIARALAKKPRILLFDEATSALDNKTQAIVSKPLESLRVTRIVIAHRLSTIINADRIYALHEGEVVQEGKYSDLIKEKGFFQDLATRQLV